MKQIYNIKSPATHQEQLDILISRGLLVGDEAFALDVLRRLNYYVLIGYFDEFREATGRYFEGLTFEHVYRLYQLDQRLRNLILYAVDNVEQVLKNAISYEIAHKLEPMAYFDAKYYENPRELAFLKRDFDRMLRKNKHVPYVQHHMEKYGGHFPVWVAIELFTLAMVSKFYDNFGQNTRRNIASGFHTGTEQLSDWLGNVRNLRNLCAHNMRLYHFDFPDAPMICRHNFAGFIPSFRVYDSIFLCKFLFRNPQDWNCYVVEELSRLFDQYPEVNIHTAYGFPKSWKKQLLLPF